MEFKNKKARFNYEFVETFNAGIILKGTEIKSIREGKVSFTDSYCLFVDEELFMRNVHIAEYEQGNINNHDPKRDRKLLLNKNELFKLKSKTQEKGLTIVPVRIYLNEINLAKVEIALAKGKKIHDKRDKIRQKDIDRELDELPIS